MLARRGALLRALRGLGLRPSLPGLLLPPAPLSPGPLRGSGLRLARLSLAGGPGLPLVGLVCLPVALAAAVRQPQKLTDRVLYQLLTVSDILKFPGLDTPGKLCYSWVKMVAASELYSLCGLSQGGHSRITKPRDAATVPGLFFSRPTTEQTAMQPGGNRARFGQPMQRVGPGDGLPIEGTGVIPHQKTSPVAAVRPDAASGICHRSDAGQLRGVVGGLANGPGSVCLEVPPARGEPCSKTPTICLVDAPHLLGTVSHS